MLQVPQQCSGTGSSHGEKRAWLAKGYSWFVTAWLTLQGIEVVNIRKGRVRWWRREMPSHNGFYFRAVWHRRLIPHPVRHSTRLSKSQSSQENLAAIYGVEERAPGGGRSDLGAQAEVNVAHDVRRRIARGPIPLEEAASRRSRPVSGRTHKISFTSALSRWRGLPRRSQWRDPRQQFGFANALRPDVGHRAGRLRALLNLGAFGRAITGRMWSGSSLKGSGSPVFLRTTGNVEAATTQSRAMIAIVQCGRVG